MRDVDIDLGKEKVGMESKAPRTKGDSLKCPALFYMAHGETPKKN